MVIACHCSHFVTYRSIIYISCLTDTITLRSLHTFINYNHLFIILWGFSQLILLDRLHRLCQQPLPEWCNLCTVQQHLHVCLPCRLHWHYVRDRYDSTDTDFSSVNVPKITLIFEHYCLCNAELVLSHCQSRFIYSKLYHTFHKRELPVIDRLE